MGPGSCHRLCHLLRIQVGEDLFDPTQFGNGVDFVCSQGIDQLVFVVLQGWSVVAHERGECTKEIDNISTKRMGREDIKNTQG